MLTILTTTTFDPLGAVQLHCLPESDMPEQRRRVNRIATLDGGAVVNDFGYADADLTLTLRWVPRDADTDAAIARLVRLYGTLQVAVSSGVFLAAVESYRPGADESELSLLITERLTPI
jgi:hypothetical protein